MAKLLPNAPFFTGIKLGLTLLKTVTRLISITLVTSFSVNGNRKWNILILQLKFTLPFIFLSGSEVRLVRD